MKEATGMSRFYVGSDGTWYRIPDGLKLPEGDLVLYGLLKGRLWVDPAAVESLAVDRAEVEAALRDSVAAWATGSLARLGRWHRTLTEAGPPTLDQLEDVISNLETTASDSLQQVANRLRSWMSRGQRPSTEG